MRIYEITDTNSTIFNIHEIDFMAVKLQLNEALNLLEQLKWISNKMLVARYLPDLKKLKYDADFISAMEWDTPDNDVDPIVVLAKTFLVKFADLDNWMKS